MIQLQKCVGGERRRIELINLLCNEKIISVHKNLVRFR
jgi:hypothetical protein